MQNHYVSIYVALKYMQYPETLVPLCGWLFIIRDCRRKTRRKKNERNFYEAVT